MRPADLVTWLLARGRSAATTGPGHGDATVRVMKVNVLARRPTFAASVHHGVYWRRRYAVSD